MDSVLAQAPAFFSAGNIAFVLAALWRTIAMTAIGCSLGFVFGLGIAILRRSTIGWLAPARWLAALYVETFRRVPFLVILIMALFALQPVAPQLSLLAIATIAVTLVATAFLSETIRGGLDSVPRQQWEGAAALNFGAWHTLVRVMLPQAMRVILPPASAFVVMFVKDTSLASHLGVVELTFSGKILVNRGFSPVLGFGVILVLYFALSWPLSIAAARLEKRLAAPRHR
ncbi:amino acid ABC transporter permease [Sphingomonas baiyangensis]|nr:amino acid ABC transporter permease [Sphingomonas baiyangensis]